jgi:hypothetical protein
VGPTADPYHALVVFHVVRVGLVTIRLEEALIIGEERVQFPVAPRQA